VGTGGVPPREGRGGQASAECGQGGAGTAGWAQGMVDAALLGRSGVLHCPPMMEWHRSHGRTPTDASRASCVARCPIRECAAPD
jgi:hypothetical protein